jgi:hypothetical protein
MGGILGLYDVSAAALPDEVVRNAVINEVIDQVNQEFPPALLQSPTESDRQRIQERVVAVVGASLRKRSLRPGFQYEVQMAEDDDQAIVREAEPMMSVSR